MPSIIKHLGVDFFVDNFLGSFMDTFKDGVSEVRLGSASALPAMADAGGAPWMYDKIFPTIKAMATEEYLLRLTLLSCIRSLLIADLSDRFQGELVSLLLTAASDAVANVRLAAALILGEACKRIGSAGGDNGTAVIAQIRPVLLELQGDKDRDVKHAAGESLKNC
jgi:HEAT repeat protein